jgi:Ca2+-binding RTX toxin-like protein
MGDFLDGGRLFAGQDGLAISATAAGVSGPQQGRSDLNGTRNRTKVGALLVVAMALLLAGGVVLAKSVSCTAGVTCNGSKKADTITGSVGDDTINGRGGADTIDGNFGTDTINGGGGADNIVDNHDTIADADTIFGGNGDDVIDVREGDTNHKADFVDCGPGIDTVFFDANDTRLNCEIFNPN